MTDTESKKEGKMCQRHRGKKRVAASLSRKAGETASLAEKGGGVRGEAGQGGGSDITLMNQCQQSDEKIIKKQACSVLNTAKGKRPIQLYWNSVWMEKNGNARAQMQKWC